VVARGATVAAMKSVVVLAALGLIALATIVGAEAAVPRIVWSSALVGAVAGALAVKSRPVSSWRLAFLPCFGGSFFTASFVVGLATWEAAQPSFVAYAMGLVAPAALVLGSMAAILTTFPRKVR
jgi:hypothetical protein